jgi:ribose 5-phosphate isomerase B
VQKISLIIGADHLGLPLKNTIKEHLLKNNYKVEDVGVNTDDMVDYPDIGEKLAKKIASTPGYRGILFCGTGAGMAIVANKIPGVRAVCINDPYTAERAIASNNAQVVTLGSLITGPEVAKKLVDIWLSNEFQQDRSGTKVDKINKIDKSA